MTRLGCPRCRTCSRCTSRGPSIWSGSTPARSHVLPQVGTQLTSTAQLQLSPGWRAPGCEDAGSPRVHQAVAHTWQSLFCRPEHGPSPRTGLWGACGRRSSCDSGRRGHQTPRHKANASWPQVHTRGQSRWTQACRGHPLVEWLLERRWGRATSELAALWLAGDFLFFFLILGISPGALDH